MKRYHKEVSFPVKTDQLLDRYFGSFESIRYSHHAKLATIRDRYGVVPVVKKHQLESAECFEIVVENEYIVSAVFRVGGSTLDYCYSVNCEGGIITCWANTKDDSHRTLDRSVYVSV